MQLKCPSLEKTGRKKAGELCCCQVELLPKRIHVIPLEAVSGISGSERFRIEGGRGSADFLKIIYHCIVYN